MTARRIFATDKPTLRFGQIKPMTKEDAEFWKLIAERKEKERERTLHRSA